MEKNSISLSYYRLMNYVVDREKLMVQPQDEEVILVYHFSTHSELMV